MKHIKSTKSTTNNHNYCQNKPEYCICKTIHISKNRNHVKNASKSRWNLRWVFQFLLKAFPNIMTQYSCCLSLLLFRKSVMFVNFRLYDFLFLSNVTFYCACLFGILVCIVIRLLCVCMFVFFVFFVKDLFLVCCVVDVCPNYVKCVKNMKSHP